MSGPLITEQLAAGWAPPAEPLRLTIARWFNRKTPVKDHDGVPGERWSKVLAHTGPYTQFRYGTDTHSSQSRSGLQRCIVCSRQSGVIAVDTDDEAEYMTTELSRYVNRQHAISVRGGGFHCLIDARSVPSRAWPKQGEIRGASGLHAADVKSNGFIPVPGSTHYSGERYEPVLHPGGTAGVLHIVTATPEIIAAITAGQQAPAAAGNGSGPGGSGGGHDGEVAARVLGWVRQALNAGLDPADPAVREDIYRQWLQVAIPRDPGYPFARDDFERHYRTAVAKAAATPSDTLPPGVAEWAAGMAAGAGSAPASVPPVTCAEAESVYARWLHDTDPVPTRIVLAAYAANMALEGDPVWVMLVGGSGIGKTERIIPVAGMRGVVQSSTLTGEAALLSATPARERAAGATGGLLRMIGARGIIVVKDFTSVLSMSGDSRAGVVAALREVYDGRWDRHYGTDGGQVLTWAGHCGFIAGCTTAIDSAHAVLDAMGTRFLLVRLPEGDRGRIGLSALRHAGHEAQMRDEMARATKGLLANLGKPHEVHGYVEEWLLRLALLASSARSPVQRDYQGEIELVLDGEAPTRIIKQLGQLWKACGMLGLDEAASWAVVRRAGLDSIPKLRRAVIGCLGREGWQTTPSVAAAAGHPLRTTRRALETLEAHGVAISKGGGGRGVTQWWDLSADAREWWKAVGDG
jgi:hypothetical protein